MLRGIDISHWNIKKRDCTFAQEDFIIIKATEGSRYIDPRMESNVRIARENNMLYGLYHFYSGTASPEMEAKHFVRAIGDNVGNAILVLDWEANASLLSSEIAERFLQTVYNLTEVRPLIYMSYSLVAQKGKWDSIASKYGLWCARYGRNDGKVYKLPSVSPWKVCAIHQYTSRGTSEDIIGYIDRNIANMTYEAWEKYAKGDRR